LGLAVALIAHICRDQLRTAILGSVARRIFQLAAGLVLILVTLTPLAESFDHWDKHVVPANDTELNITAWFVGVGIAVALAKLLRYVPTLAFSSRRPGRPRLAPTALRAVAADRPASTASPPLVPLRI
jgi:hypothetical protein